MQGWLLPSLVGFLAYGLWAFFLKLASAYLPPRWMLFYEVIGVAVVSIGYIVITRSPVVFDQKGAALAFAAGVLGATGGLFFYLALRQGKASVVIPLVTLYPVVPIVLGVLVLGEVLTLKQGAGVLCALLAMVLLA